MWFFLKILIVYLGLTKDYIIGLNAINLIFSPYFDLDVFSIIWGQVVARLLLTNRKIPTIKKQYWIESIYSELQSFSS